MLLSYRVLAIQDIYCAPDEKNGMISTFFDKMELLPVEHLAEVFINFLAR